MDQAINFGNLHAITGGNAAMESELFALFLEAATLCLEHLQQASRANDSIMWRKEAHAFKGICFNLGAQPLGLICQRAQDNPDAPQQDKEEMLAALQVELKRVREVLLKAQSGEI